MEALKGWGWRAGKILNTWQLDGTLGGGFNVFLFLPLFGEDSHFDSYSSKGLKTPTSTRLDALIEYGVLFGYSEIMFIQAPICLLSKSMEEM